LPGTDQTLLIDELRRDGLDAEGDGMPPDLSIQCLPLDRLQLLGVVQPRQPYSRGQHDRGGDRWAGERSQAHLVTARNELVAHAPDGSLESPEPRSPGAAPCLHRWTG